ncbi:MAG TPA: hypothetical protein VGE72_31005 [Azospirillum sp.]
MHTIDRVASAEDLRCNFLVNDVEGFLPLPISDNQPRFCYLAEFRRQRFLEPRDTFTKSLNLSTYCCGQWLAEYWAPHGVETALPCGDVIDHGAHLVRLH